MCASYASPECNKESSAPVTSIVENNSENTYTINTELLTPAGPEIVHVSRIRDIDSEAVSQDGFNPKAVGGNFSGATPGVDGESLSLLGVQNFLPRSCRACIGFIGLGAARNGLQV